MYVTLDQARALDALAQHGTFTKAAQALKKAHTAVLYAIKQLETQTGLTLLDRSAYRSKLTPAGEVVLGRCRALLEAERQLVDACQTLATGWEPTVRVVFDAIYPADGILEVVRALHAEGAPTRFHVASDSLDGVEARFVAEQAQVMVTVLPVRLEGVTVKRLAPLSARLVASKRHPLAKAKGPLGPEALGGHVLLTVRGSDPRLDLPTAQVEQGSTVRLSDFHSKKAAIVRGLGFGWLPEWLCDEELGRGELVALKLASGSQHRFEPRLVHLPALGPAARRVVAALTTP